MLLTPPSPRQPFNPSLLAPPTLLTAGLGCCGRSRCRRSLPHRCISAVSPHSHGFSSFVTCAFVFFFVCLIASPPVGLPFVILTARHSAFQRGFFCSDDSIKYPYKEDTISYQLLGGVMIPVTVLTVSATLFASFFLHTTFESSLSFASTFRC